MKPGDRNTDQTTGGRGTHYFLGPLLNPTRAWDVPARVTIIRGYSDSIVERDETLLVLLLSIKKKKKKKMKYKNKILTMPTRFFHAPFSIFILHYTNGGRQLEYFFKNPLTYPFIRYSSLSTLGTCCYSKHSWHIVDRLDPYMHKVSPEDLTPFNPEGKRMKNLYKLYGLQSYVFSNIMSLDIDPEGFEAKYDVVLAAARRFLNALKDDTVYKCLFVGVTSEGDVKSSAEGAFYVTKHSRPEYIVMKVKGGATLLAFKYKGSITFDSYTLAYKE